MKNSFKSKHNKLIDEKNNNIDLKEGEFLEKNEFINLNITLLE